MMNTSQNESFNLNASFHLDSPSQEQKKEVKKGPTMLAPVHTYSVICKTNVTAFCISKEDLLEFIPKEIKGLLIG